MSYLTLNQAAAELTVSRRTVERLVREGRIRVVYISPGCPRVTHKELDAYMASIERRRVA